jgi:pantothenate kinase
LKLYQYDDIKKLNQALGSFAKNNVPVIKVDIKTISEKVAEVVVDKIQYFVLADPKEVFKMPITEDKAKETVKIKKEKPLKTK